MISVKEISYTKTRFLNCRLCAKQGLNKLNAYIVLTSGEDTLELDSRENRIEYKKRGNIGYY